MNVRPTKIIFHMKTLLYTMQKSSRHSVLKTSRPVNAHVMQTLKNSEARARNFYSGTRQGYFRTNKKKRKIFLVLTKETCFTGNIRNHRFKKKSCFKIPRNLGMENIACIFVQILANVGNKMETTLVCLIKVPGRLLFWGFFLSWLLNKD